MCGKVEPMKRIIAAALALLLAGAQLACKNDVKNPGDGNQGPETEIAESTQQTLPTELVPGAFTALNGDGLKIKGLKFSADRTGESGINSWDFSLTRVRSVFELNELISYSIDYEYGDAPGKLGVWLFEHRMLSEYKDVPGMEGQAFFCEFELPYQNYPAPLEDFIELPSEYFASGDYDMLFTYNGALIGGMVLRFFNQGELAGKTDIEIENLMAVG